jgi:hypothetical protein
MHVSVSADAVRDARRHAERVDRRSVMTTSVAPDRPRADRKTRYLPTSSPGKWAVGLAVASVPLQFAWMILPGGAALAMACAFAGGVLGATAIIRHGERAIAVYATLVPFVMTVAFIIAELVIGHD